MGCINLQCLDLSYCNNFGRAPGCEALWVLPESLSELNLCGILLEDKTIFVECFQRLKNLRVVRLCGVTALTDDTLTQVQTSSESPFSLAFYGIIVRPYSI